MANETTTTTAAEFTLAAALFEEIQEALYSMAVMRGLVKVINIAGRHSKAIDLPKWNVLTAGALTEGAAPTAQTFDPTEVTVTVAERGLDLKLTKLLLRVGIADLMDYVREATRAVVDDFDTQLCVSLATFSNTVGTTTVDLTEDNILNAVRALSTLDSPGPYSGVLHNVQWYDLQTSAGSALGFMSSGSVADGTGALAMKRGFVGHHYGVDWYTSTNVPTANCAADRAGAVFTPSRAIACAILWEIEVQSLFDPLTRNTNISIDAAYGSAEYNDSDGVSIITDA